MRVPEETTGLYSRNSGQNMGGLRPSHVCFCSYRTSPVITGTRHRRIRLRTEATGPVSEDDPDRSPEAHGGRSADRSAYHRWQSFRDGWVDRDDGDGDADQDGEALGPGAEEHRDPVSDEVYSQVSEEAEHRTDVRPREAR